MDGAEESERGKKKRSGGQVGENTGRKSLGLWKHVFEGSEDSEKGRGYDIG